MKVRTLLVDSNYLLQRSYHGAKNTSTVKFGEIGGLYSFLTTIRKQIKLHRINKVVLVWDGENGGIGRHQLDELYKSKRLDKKWNEKIVLTDREIKKELNKKRSILKNKVRIKAYAEELFLRQIEVDDIEADDIIAKYCVDYNNTEEIFIFTNDRDFLQLLSLNITIIFSNIEQPVDKNNFFIHFKYHYSNALTMKVICGDTSDTITGIDGLGEDTMMKHFPQLEFEHMSVREICGMAKVINEERVAKKLKPLKALNNLLNGVERLKLNYRLINLFEPFINDDVINEMEQLKMPLSPEDRGSRYLIKLMNDDDFLTVYGGNFVNYVEPFYTVIQCERDKYKTFMQNSKKII